MTQPPLGEFEAVVLMAVMHRRLEASGTLVRDDIEVRTGRPVTRGAVYVTLDRLEEKGLLTSRTGDASPERGGRPRRFFKVTPKGLTAVRHSVATLARMHKGLEPILGEL